MKMCKFALGLAAILLAAGCIPSLHPLYTSDTLVAEPRLIGEWVEDSAENHWKFTQVDEFTVELVYTENNEPASFEVHAVKLDKYLFIDMFPEEPNFKNGLYKGSFLPVHNFARIEFAGDSLQVFMLDMEYIENQIEQGKTSIAHEKIDSDIMLTAPSAELQKFVLQYATDDKAFSVESILLKKK